MKISQMRRATQAFTLIELMVVLLIISLLASVLYFSISGAFGEGKKAECETQIQNLHAWTNKFYDAYNIVPPSDISTLGYQIFPEAGEPPALGNPENAGIEALVVALRTKAMGPFITNDFLSKYQMNADGDETDLSMLQVEGSGQLFEIRDPWDNPLVYVTKYDLGSDGGGGIPDTSVQNESGDIVSVTMLELRQALEDPETKMIMTSDLFFIWSFGPDGINDYGQNDDICSWKK